MEITLDGTPNEIAALVLEVQERRIKTLLDEEHSLATIFQSIANHVKNEDPELWASATALAEMFYTC